MPQGVQGRPPATEESGQSSRFSNDFNPAFSFIVDAIGDYLSTDRTDGDGFATSLRTVEIAAQAWVDPTAWAYFVAASEDESIAVEEGAVHYTGLGGNSTLRIGRYFLDFGKQMQVHVHELRTVERPLVLRAYLGEEVKGDGLQWESWTTVGSSSAVRWSLGVFSNLLPEEQDFLSESLERSIEDRKDLGDLNLSARLTGFRDIGEQGVLQLGVSLRAIPEYSVQELESNLTEDGLESNVFGADVTYGWTSDSGLERWTLGSELLLSQGDTGFALLDPDGTAGSGDESLDVSTDSLLGYFAYADYAWNSQSSVGLQFSNAEIASSIDAREMEIYYTRHFSEYHRLRFSIAQTEVDEQDDETRFMIQYTAFVGAHGHGVNW